MSSKPIHSALFAGAAVAIALAISPAASAAHPDVNAPNTEPIVIARSPLAPTAPAHAFTIVLPGVAAPDDTARFRLDRVITAAIPAHTSYDLRLVEPGITVGHQSTLGIDMLIGSIHPHPPGDAGLGGDAMFPPGRFPLALVPDEGVPDPGYLSGWWLPQSRAAHPDRTGSRPFRSTID